MISIQGGDWRGRKLKVVESDDLRPTSSRVKSAIFNIIESIVWKRSGAPPDFSAWNCVDLFSGIGGLGFELLSRGASRMIFVEKNRRHAKVLEANIQSLDCQDRTILLQGDVLDVPWENYGAFDIVLADAPYAFTDYQKIFEKLTNSKNSVSDETIVVLEHEPKFVMPEMATFAVHSTRHLGPAGITVLLKK